MRILLTPSQWNATKWIANVCFLIATVAMLSPTVAATAITPWAIYLVANGVWMWDSAIAKNWAWVWLAMFFCVWDVLLIVTRLFGFEFFAFLQPLVNILERLP